MHNQTCGRCEQSGLKADSNQPAHLGTRSLITILALLFMVPLRHVIGVFSFRKCHINGFAVPCPKQPNSIKQNATVLLLLNEHPHNHIKTFRIRQVPYCKLPYQLLSTRTGRLSK